MSFVELETDSRASPGAVSSGRMAGKRVSVQQSRPAWQPDGFRCSDCGRSRFGFPVLAVRAPKRRGLIGLSVVFTTKYSGKLGVRRFRWGPDCTETRFAANAPARTAPKRVFLPPGASGLHRNPPSRHRWRESGRSSGTGPRDIASPPLPSSAPAPRAPLTSSASPAPRAPEGVPARTPLVLAGVPPAPPPRPRPRLFRLFRFPANLRHMAVQGRILLAQGGATRGFAPAKRHRCR